MADRKRVYIEITGRTSLGRDDFTVDPFELRGINGVSFKADEDTMFCEQKDDGTCIISGYADTAVPAALLRLNAVRMFIPSEEREIAVSGVPGRNGDVPADNPYFAPLLLRIIDRAEEAVYHF